MTLIQKRRGRLKTEKTAVLFKHTPLPMKTSFELGDIPVGLPDVYSV